MNEKGIDAFRTISEVADELKLPQHVLRFWETRFSQIKPMKRGGGRRYYKPDDVELLRGIRYLLYVKGFTIKGVQRILKQNGPRFVVAVGSGDAEALEAMQSGRQGAPSVDDPADGPHFADADLLAADGLEAALEADLDQGEPETPARGPQVEHPDPEKAVERASSSRAVSENRGALAGFLKRPRDRPDASSTDRGLPRASIETLDAVILELLECKRILDQVR